MEKQIRILFVCHGNICRSPMAEFILREKAKELGLEDTVIVASAATSEEELGNPVDPRAAAILHAHGIDCAEKRARQMCKCDYDAYDYLIGMDTANIRNMIRIAGGEDSQGKIYKMLSFAGYEHTHRLSEAGDVADPWYTGDFEATWQDVNIGCRALLKELTEKK